MDDEAKETNATTSINIVSTNRLIKDETFSSSLKVLKTQMKKYAKKLTNKIKEESPAEAENFKKNLEAALQKIFAKYEDLQFFTGASDEFEGEGMLAIAEYRDKKPFMLFFKHGLKEERVVSLSSCIKTFTQIFFWFGCHFKVLFIPVWGEIHPSIPPVTFPPPRSFEGWGEEMADFGKLPTYPSPTATLTLSSYLGQNVSFGEG